MLNKLYYFYPYVIISLFLTLIIYANKWIFLITLMSILWILIMEINRLLNCGYRISIQLTSYMFNIFLLIFFSLYNSNNILFLVVYSLIGNFFIYYFFIQKSNRLKINVSLSIVPQALTYILFAMAILISAKFRLISIVNEKTLLFIIVAVGVQDFSAKYFGKRFPYIKYISLVSSHKTICGTLLGFVASYMVCWKLAKTIDIHLKYYYLLLILIAGIFGDLYFSNIKRIYFKKDFGTILGSQGGLLDRLDSCIFPIITGYLMGISNLI